MLLKEVRVLTDLQVISESRETGVMCIRGTFQRAEEANHNQRIYPKAVLENCVKSLSEKLSGRELVGELDHPADGVVKLQNASHLITKLEWQGNDLIGEAEILPTPAGQIAKSLINAGVKIGISSRGMGTLSESARGAKIVNDDYKMITFDLVADPSTKGAYPSLAESKQHAIDFVENVIKPAISEKAFVARLKKALNESKISQRQFSKFEVLLENNETATDEENYARKLNASENRPTGEDLDDHPDNPDKKKKKKVEEMCGPKHNKRKQRKMNDSIKPLTLETLNEFRIFGMGFGRDSRAAVADRASKILRARKAAARASGNTQFDYMKNRRIAQSMARNNPGLTTGRITRDAEQNDFLSRRQQAGQSPQDPKSKQLRSGGKFTSTTTARKPMSSTDRASVGQSLAQRADARNAAKRQANISRLSSMSSGGSTPTPTRSAPTPTRSAPSSNFGGQMAGSMRRFGRKLRSAGSSVRDALALKHLQTSSRIPLTLPSLMEAKAKLERAKRVGKLTAAGKAKLRYKEAESEERAEKRWAAQSRGERQVTPDNPDFDKYAERRYEMDY